jgi:LysM repeat protein
VIAPQEYWRTFDTQPNYDRFRETGYTVPGNVTPEFLLTMSQTLLAPYGLPLLHVGQGDAPNTDEWNRYLAGAFALGSDYISVWRYGVTPDAVFKYLRDNPAKQPPVAPVVASAGNYTVQAGDTLGVIAANYGTTVDEIMAANGLSDPNYLYVGQQLVIPGAGGVVVAASAGTSGPAQASAAPATGGEAYIVQSGDTLSAIAYQYGTSVQALTDANGLADPNYLYVGQQIYIA